MLNTFPGGVERDVHVAARAADLHVVLGNGDRRRLGDRRRSAATVGQQDDLVVGVGCADRQRLADGFVGSARVPSPVVSCRPHQSNVERTAGCRMVAALIVDTIEGAQLLRGNVCDVRLMVVPDRLTVVVGLPISAHAHAT